jgi:hypothetical protein
MRIWDATDRSGRAYLREGIMLDKLSAKDCMVGCAVCAVVRAKFVAEWVVVLAKERALWAVAEAVADTEDVTSDTSTL